MINERTATTFPFTRKKRQTAQSKQIAQNQAAIRLIESWLADDSDYDEQVWPILQQAIEENRLSDRPRFAD